MGRADIVDRLAVEQHEGVPVDESFDAFPDRLGDRGDDRAAVAVPHEDDVAQFVLLNVRHRRCGSGLVADRAVDVVAVAVAGQCRGVNGVALGLDVPCDVGPPRPVMPCPVDKNVGVGHAVILLSQ